MKAENKKRAISLALAAVMLCMSLPPAYAYGYGDPYSNYIQNEFDRNITKPLKNLGNLINKKYHDARVAVGLDDPKSYTNAVIDDTKTAAVTYGKNWASDGLKAGVSKYTNPYINKLFRSDYVNAIRGMKEQREIISNSKNAGEVAAAMKRYDNYLDALNKAKDGKAALKAGRVLPIDFIFAAWGVYDMLNDPEIGYDSPFFEFCASEIKAYSNTIGLIPIIGKPLSLPFTIIDFITSSKTVVKAVNDSKIKIQCLDNATSWWNNFITKDSFFNPIGKVAKWWFSDIGREQEKNAKDIAVKVSVLKITKIGAGTMGAMGGGPFAQMAIGATCTANGINVYKPNIYLYPKEPTQIDVNFEYPDLLTVSDPEYNTGWTVDAKPDGTLYKDGEEYGFLFYESRTEKGYYQFDEGYIIPENDRSAAFEDILKGYGLNGKEIEDFCEFWCDKLDKDGSYAMYPQLTQTVDAAMPVNITPAPDSSLRLWLAFVKNDKPKTEAKPEKFKRNGYSMVEWGGFVVEKAE